MLGIISAIKHAGFVLEQEIRLLPAEIELTRRANEVAQQRKTGQNIESEVTVPYKKEVNKPLFDSLKELLTTSPLDKIEPMAFRIVSLSGRMGTIYSMIGNRFNMIEIIDVQLKRTYLCSYADFEMAQKVEAAFKKADGGGSEIILIPKTMYSMERELAKIVPQFGSASFFINENDEVVWYDDIYKQKTFEVESFITADELMESDPVIMEKTHHICQSWLDDSYALVFGYELYDFWEKRIIGLLEKVELREGEYLLEQC